MADMDRSELVVATFFGKSTCSADFRPNPQRRTIGQSRVRALIFHKRLWGLLGRCGPVGTLGPVP